MTALDIFVLFIPAAPYQKAHLQRRAILAYWICSSTNLIAGRGCPAYTEIYAPGTEPRTACNGEAHGRNYAEEIRQEKEAAERAAREAQERAARAAAEAAKKAEEARKAAEKKAKEAEEKAKKAAEAASKAATPKPTPKP